MSEDVSLSDLRLCFEGVVPAVIATAAADGTPNVTYLSKVRMVDDERVALSNQFFSKTTRNLAENPRASILLIQPVTYDQYRLTLAYERTERRGEVFERLREDVDAVAAIEGMQDVFKLRAADIYRVLHIEELPAAGRVASDTEASVASVASDTDTAARLGELTARLSRCPDLDTLVSATVDGLADVFGYEHSLLLLLDEEGKGLYTIASKGYDVQGVGSEVTVGEGIIGLAAARCAPIRLGNLRQMSKYSRTVRQSYEDEGHIGPGLEIPVPGLAEAQSRVAVPAMAFGQLVGVVVVESNEPVAFTATDEALLTVIASVAANAIEVGRTQERDEGARTADSASSGSQDPTKPSTHVRFFSVDGSTFLDGEYLIKGVSGRILWSLLGHYDAERRVEFTNREVRLDPTLELPEFRDNFESRLILLKRRLDERNAPIRIEKTGRGRFRLVVDRPLRLEQA
jgi:adenylate cyclase